MNSTITTEQAPKVATCPFCGHAGTHAPATVTPSGGVKYCSSCPVCETGLEKIANAVYARPPRPLAAADQ